MNTTLRIRLSAIAAFTLVAFTSTASGTAGRLPPPLGVGYQPLAAGVHVLDLVAREHRGQGGPTRLPRVAITMPRGWFNYDGWGMNDGGTLIVAFWDVDKVYATGCRWQGKPKIAPGPTVDDLASALAARPLRHATTPADVTLAGFHGKYLSWSVPSTVNFSSCGQSYFESWTAKGWASDRYQQGPGQVDRLWILDVKGQRLLIDAAYMPWATRQQRAELDHVVHSIRFLSGSARKTASAPERTAVPRIEFVGVTGINDRGQIVGNLLTKAGRVGGFVWENGETTVLTSIAVAGNNARGQVIGTKGDRGVLWENGKTEDLGHIEPTAISQRGQIIGARAVPSGNGFTSAPVFWEDGKVVDLPLSPAAINDRGQIVGQTPAGDAAELQDGKLTDLGPGSPLAINDRGEILGTRDGDVVVWQDGTSTDLGPGWPVAINKRGEVLGMHQAASGENQPFVWQNGTMTDLGTLGGAWLWPTAISDRGQVVGYGTDSSAMQHGFVWQRGTMTVLPSPPGNRNLRTRAIAINDRDQIVGDNCAGDCELRAYWARSAFVVLWTLTPHGIITRKILGRG
jgi:probable HAF family extracellular repeat protein